MKPVFEYLDYREYIRDFYTFHKKESGLSYRSFAAKAGFASPVFIKMVIENKTKLSRESIGKLARAMNLTHQSRLFFHRMVMYCQAENINSKMKYLSEMKELASGTTVNQLTSDQVEFYQHWYNPVVREIVHMTGNADPVLVAAKVIPPITVREAADSIALLVRLGLVERAEDGTIISKESIVSSEGLTVGSLLIKATQKKLAELAGESLETIDKSERDISGFTASLSEKTMAQVADELRKCRHRIMELAENDKKPDRVYRVNFHLFPLSLKTGGDHEKN